MAHKINDMFNRLEKRETVLCNSSCEYWMFGHLRRPCVLSDVYSVNQNEPCYEYKKRVEPGNY